MNDHVRDLASVRDATDRLLAAAAALNNVSTAEPSRLPGWTRGHVLAHVARNADALVNVLAGRPMYVSGDARDADIERDAPRPLDVQLADLRASAARFQEEGAAPADWSRTVELRNGVKDSAANVPFRRWIEVELHHVDLGVGYELEDLSAEFTQREIDFLAHRFRNHPALPALAIRQDDGRVLATGAVDDVTLEQGREGYERTVDVTVSGRQADLLGWLAGRRDGAALTADGGSLPALPPL
ncbi:maleylpyruvate isomerase family mycothiol-dependent enzyme [Streptomyces flavofungini]|uniref:Maleylpyruvate isomerase family mycothiol-dependent enzyme n=1 Tax=Streptomyces flavofungini TaxID=68200 RepID=A0ABS0X369_9ACTN|nr:maleylpyruvate isomerase family mycothiol-dependent enzyme [Streptomyces flavofungini]MBJ3807628.1 maleylpyruvate isomerase family mycothiol-dependent enzyme [Streptomyces flavofungini]GHC64357.1 maleylpyruvate isomerase [Streptomyces flavofungini]